MMNVKVPGVGGYDEDQITIVMDDPGMTEWPVILGTPTIYRVMEVIKESEISKCSAMGLLTSLLVGERRTGQAGPCGGERYSQQTDRTPLC